MRNKFAETFYELAKADNRLCAIVADISPAGSIQKFREEFPHRFINTGVAEQIMIGMAAGMAQRGMNVFCYTIATFALFRPFEFIRNDLAYQNLPVTVVGIGGGLTYSTLGATHHAMEDVAVARSIPNLNVIAPCDPLETEAATRWCAQNKDGPVYLRLGKAGERVLTQFAEPWEFGKLRYITRSEDDTWCVLSYGPIASVALSVAEKLRTTGRGINASVAVVHTLSPTDIEGLSDFLFKHKEVLVIEESFEGPLSLSLRSIAQCERQDVAISCFALFGGFSHIYGTHNELLDHYDLTAEKILAQF